MGLDWRMMLALLTSFAAKENSIATLGVLFGAGEVEASLATMLQEALTADAALAFLVVQMLFLPCVATVAAMRQETGGWKWPLRGIVLLLVISLVGGIVTYQIARAL